MKCVKDGLSIDLFTLSVVVKVTVQAKSEDRRWDKWQNGICRDTPDWQPLL